MRLRRSPPAALPDLALRSLLLAALVALGAGCAARQLRSSDYIWVDDFDSAFGWQWKEVSTRGQTRYQKVRPGEDSPRALRAVAQASASELVRKVQVDLAQFPELIWSWRVMNVIEAPPPRGSSGMDFPARVRLHFAADE